jgi:hypothetical protein
MVPPKVTASRGWPHRKVRDLDLFKSETDVVETSRFLYRSFTRRFLKPVIMPAFFCPLRNASLPVLKPGTVRERFPSFSRNNRETSP